MSEAQPSQSTAQLSHQWRREWEESGRPAHSCIQEACPPLDGKTLCGVCGADMTDFAEGTDA